MPWWSAPVQGDRKGRETGDEAADAPMMRLLNKVLKAVEFAMALLRHEVQAVMALRSVLDEFAVVTRRTPTRTPFAVAANDVNAVTWLPGMAGGRPNTAVMICSRAVRNSGMEDSPSVIGSTLIDQAKLTALGESALSVSVEQPEGPAVVHPTAQLLSQAAQTLSASYVKTGHAATQTPAAVRLFLHAAQWAGPGPLHSLLHCASQVTHVRSEAAYVPDGHEATHVPETTRDLHAVQLLAVGPVHSDAHCAWHGLHCRCASAKKPLGHWNTHEPR